MKSVNLLDKLKGVERTINIYRNVDTELMQEISINTPIDVLKTIVTPRDGDAMLYLGYILNEKQLEELGGEIGHLIEPDFDQFYYVLECTGIYDW